MCRPTTGCGPSPGSARSWPWSCSTRSTTSNASPPEGQFLSYARLVRPTHESAGKVVGSGRQKIGNAHLRWAFGEAACLFLRGSVRAKRWKERQQKKRGEGKALGILAARLARAVFHLWRKREAFDEDRFWGGKAKEDKTGSSSLSRVEEEAGHAAD